MRRVPGIDCGACRQTSSRRRTRHGRRGALVSVGLAQKGCRRWTRGSWKLPRSSEADDVAALESMASNPACIGSSIATKSCGCGATTIRSASTRSPPFGEGIDPVFFATLHASVARASVATTIETPKTTHGPEYDGSIDMPKPPSCHRLWFSLASVFETVPPCVSEAADCKPWRYRGSQRDEVDDRRDAHSVRMGAE